MRWSEGRDLERVEIESCFSSLSLFLPNKNFTSFLCLFQANESMSVLNETEKDR